MNFQAYFAVAVGLQALCDWDSSLPVNGQELAAAALQQYS
jgi:hypothetical protein